MKINLKKIFPFISVLFLFFFAVSYITYPLLFNSGSLVSGYGDELFIAWVHNWVIHALFTDPLHLFQANIFYPYENTLAFSDFFLTSSILSIPALLVVGEPIAAFNFTFFSSLVLVGFSTYLLSYYITRNHYISIFSGVLLIFSPVVLDKKVHVQALSVQYIPLSILFFLIFLKIQKIRFLIISAFFFLLQTYNSFMPGYFLVFYYGIVTVILFLFDRKKYYLLIQKKVIIIFIATVLLLLPVVIPYVKVSKDYGAKRDIRDAIHFALQPEDLLYANDNTRLQPLLQLIQNSNKYPPDTSLKPGYIGIVFSFLVLGSMFFIRKYWKRKDVVFLSFFVSSILGLILSLGPALHWGRVTIHPIIPLPYALFYYVLPGFQGFRNSARFEMMFVLFFSIVIAIILNELWKKWGKKSVLFIAILFVGVVVEFSFPLRFVSIASKEQFPPEHQFLQQSSPDSIYIEMPLYSWNMSPFSAQEIKRVYFSTLHFRRTPNGFSGFSPLSWESFAWEMIEKFPDTDSLGKLEDAGVNYLIIHEDEYDRISESDFRANGKRVKSGQEISKELLKQENVELIHKNGKVSIFLLND